MKNIILVDKIHGIKENIFFTEALNFIKTNRDQKDKPFWIDFYGSTNKEILEIAQIIPIYHLTQEDILSRKVREKSGDFDEYLYVVGHGLNFNTGKKYITPLTSACWSTQPLFCHFTIKKLRP